MDDELVKNELGRDCGCLSTLVWAMSCLAGALVLFLWGDEVLLIAGWMVLGSWLALPAAIGVGALTIMLAPVVFGRERR